MIFEDPEIVHIFRISPPGNNNVPNGVSNFPITQADAMKIHKIQGCKFTKTTFINIGKRETIGLSFTAASRVVRSDLLYFDHISFERFQKIGE